MRRSRGFGLGRGGVTVIKYLLPRRRETMYHLVNANATFHGATYRNIGSISHNWGQLLAPDAEWIDAMVLQFRSGAVYQDAENFLLCWNFLVRDKRKVYFLF
jgi:hypothetical protein